MLPPARDVALLRLGFSSYLDEPGTSVKQIECVEERVRLVRDPEGTREASADEWEREDEDDDRLDEEKDSRDAGQRSPHPKFIFGQNVRPVNAYSH